REYWPEFRGIWPKVRRRDYSRVSCDPVNLQLWRDFGGRCAHCKPNNITPSLFNMPGLRDSNCGTPKENNPVERPSFCTRLLSQTERARAFGVVRHRDHIPKNPAWASPEPKG